MNETEMANYSLADIVQKIVPIFDNCPSVEQFLFIVESFESNIEKLEARANEIQQELELLNSQS